MTPATQPVMPAATTRTAAMASALPPASRHGDPPSPPSHRSRGTSSALPAAGPSIACAHRTQPTPRAPTADETARKHRLKQRLQADLARLLLWHPFTASLALHLEIVPVRDSRVGTAATDGRYIYFDVAFAETLGDDGRAFVLAHEVWHCVLDHGHRRAGRATGPWALAIDSEVNAVLVRDGLPLPKGAVFFRDMDGASAEQIYAWLVDQAPAVPPPGLRSFDVHEPTLAAPGPGDWVEDPDFRPGGPPGQALRRAWKERVVAAERTARERGVMPAGLAQVLQQVLAAPAVPWQQVLRDFVRRSGSGGTWSYARVARRHLWRGAWLPGRHGQALALMVALDTSGSTAQAQARFVDEIAAIAREHARVDLTVVECDAAVHRVTHLTEADVGAWRQTVRRDGLRGGGGTDFRPIFELLTRPQHPAQAMVFFTDGLGHAPRNPPQLPVLWVLAGGADEPPVAWGARVWMAPDVSA